MLSMLIFALQACHFRDDSSCNGSLESYLLKKFSKPDLQLLFLSNLTSKETFSKELNTVHGKKAETLVVSDNAEQIAIAQNLGFFCVGYSNSQTFLPVSYCFEDFSSVDLKYFSRILCRYKKEPVSIVTTRHLQIRELTPSDLPALYDIYSQPGIQDYMNERYATYEDFYSKMYAYIEQFYPFYDFGLWGVFLKENNTLIGECGLQLSELYENSQICIGYLLSPDYQHQGYGEEMVQAVLRYAKREFDFTTIFAEIDARNYPSISFAKKCGFTFRDIQKKEDTTYHIYAHTFPKRKTPSAGKASKSSMKSYDDYQKNPDTSVYGKRYSC